MTLRSGSGRSTARAALIALAALVVPTASAAGDEGTTSFGIVSPQMNDCFAQPELVPECPDLEGNATGSGNRDSIIRISGEASMGILYDDGEISPEHKVKIIFEIGAQLDNGLQINSRIPLPETGNQN